jgi:hypothetical protein
MKGDIVLVPFPNSDLTPGKLRLALVLCEDDIENETTIAYISSKTPILPSPCDVLVTRGTPSFDESGLKRNSVIKLLFSFPLQKAKSILPLIGRWGWMLCSQAI